MRLIAFLLALPLSAQIIPTGNAFLDFIIGPQVAIGSPDVTQPWFDTVFSAAAGVAYQNQQISTNYALHRFAPWYLNFKTGTISISGSSATVTGSGTNFPVDVCAGITGVPASATFISWPYTGKNDGLQHYTMKNVASCNSATSITISGAYPASPGDELPTCAPCSAMQYSTYNESDGNFFAFGSQPEDYYDNGMASKILYVRGGNTADRDGYRNIVDYHFQSPEFDQGYVYSTGNNWNPEIKRGESRTYALDGVFIRADDGKSNYWAGLRIIRDYMMTTVYMQPQTTFVADQRDGAYDVRFLSIGCFGDPNSGEKTTWCTDLKTGGWDNLQANTINGSDQNFYAQWYSGISSFDGGGGTVSISGTTVTLSGRTWSSGDFLPFPGQMTSGLMIFNTPGTNPGTNAGGFYPCTFASATSCTGLTGWMGGNVSGKGFALPISSFGVVGMTGQPFMMALLVSADELANIAMTARGETAYAANFAANSTRAVNWLMTYGYYTAEQGNYYFSSANCQPLTTLGVCTSAINTNQTRMYAVETPYAMAMNYRRTLSGAVKTFGQNLMSALWVQRTCTVNPQYVADYDLTCAGFGFNLQIVAGQPGPGNPKYYGQGFGVGDTSTVFAIFRGTATSSISGNATISGKATF